MKKILITGAKGFLGSYVSQHFKKLGYKTYGIGHGDLLVSECEKIGLDYWYKSDVCIKSILDIGISFDVIVHCGGSGSVGFSVEHPYEDFKKTVDGTLEVLEYIRLYNSKAHFIYPSSPAVQGECKDDFIIETYVGKPASPYGYHKKIAEDLCQSYSEKYNLHISILRLFSVYGIGLKKQLLWDACNKIMNAKNQVEFWGTGEETRDFIHVNDVVSLISKLLQQNEVFLIVNGGTGKRITVKEIVYLIKQLINSDCTINFNNQVSEGNPRYYLACMKKQIEYCSQDMMSIEDGITEYIQWIKKI